METHPTTTKQRILTHLTRARIAELNGDHKVAKDERAKAAALRGTHSPTPA